MIYMLNRSRWVHLTEVEWMLRLMILRLKRSRRRRVWLLLLLAAQVPTCSGLDNRADIEGNEGGFWIDMLRERSSGG